MHMPHFLRLKSSGRLSKIAEEEPCVPVRPGFSAASNYHYKAEQPGVGTLKYFPFWSLQSDTNCRIGTSPTRGSLSAKRGGSVEPYDGRHVWKYFTVKHLTACEWASVVCFIAQAILTQHIYTTLSLKCSCCWICACNKQDEKRKSSESTFKKVLASEQATKHHMLLIT